MLGSAIKEREGIFFSRYESLHKTVIQLATSYL